MLLEPGYTYHTRNIVDSFMGKLKIDGEFIHNSTYEYQGWLKVLGKKRILQDCKIIDGEYDYWFSVIGLHMHIHAKVTDEGEILGVATASGHAPMPVTGGAVKRVRLSDQTVDEDFHWPDIEKYRWKQ